MATDQAHANFEGRLSIERDGRAHHATLEEFSCHPCGGADVTHKFACEWEAESLGESTWG